MAPDGFSARYDSSRYETNVGFPPYVCPFSIIPRRHGAYGRHQRTGAFTTQNRDTHGDTWVSLSLSRSLEQPHATVNPRLRRRRRGHTTDRQTLRASARCRSTNSSSNAWASGCPIILALMKAGLSERLSIPSITHTTRTRRWWWTPSRWC